MGVDRASSFGTDGRYLKLTIARIPPKNLVRAWEIAVDVSVSYSAWLGSL